MAAKKKEKQEQAPDVAQQPKKKSPLLKILIVVVALGALGWGGFFAYTKFFAKETTPQEVEAKTEPAKVNVKSLETFLVNLADPGGERYLKVTMQLSLNNESVSQEIDSRMAELRDSILMLLSSKEYDDISSLSGKLALKKTLINNLNRVLKKGTVLDIYFTEFLVQ
ncbi:flagellar basal body-associated FliL family protein [Desulfosoma sp.]|uniref:flagellar basal body-associated FliL family protein n=1 Tax=Desulfosoma sp. TaxID=2603217 RepID=UPI00404A2E71